MLGYKIAARTVLNADFSRNQLGGARLGDIAWVAPTNDGIGWRGYRLIQVLQAGGMSAREICRRVPLVVSGTVTAAAGETNSTRQLSDTGEFTEDPTHVGDLLVVLDKLAVAGAAPEGEFAIISFQDLTGTNFVRFEENFALTVAPAVGDTYRIHRQWRGEDSVDGDENYNILGANPVAVTVNNFTWTQCYGICIIPWETGGAGAPPDLFRGVMVGAVAGDDVATGRSQLNIGLALAASGAGDDAARATIHIDVLFGLRGVNALNS